MSLTADEMQHLHKFHASRPDWEIVVAELQMGDETVDAQPVGEYPTLNPYLLGMKWTMERVLRSEHHRILDIGSPMAQVIALSAAGVDVTVVDIRSHPDAEALGIKWCQSNVTSLPYEDKSWPCVTSCWVIGHVGDGRYGDTLNVDGDLDALREIARVCSDYAIVGVGLIDDINVNIFNLHRVYSWQWLERAFEQCGLRIIEKANLPVRKDVYFGASFEDRKMVMRKDGFYGIAACRPL